jgi:hypothetical protein
VSVHELRRGKTRSCGCIKPERIRKLGKAHVRRQRSKTDAELIGKCFGTRTVIGRLQSRPYYFLVRCQQCGEERTMRGDRIRRARTCLCSSNKSPASHDCRAYASLGADCQGSSSANHNGVGSHNHNMGGDNHSHSHNRKRVSRPAPADEPVCR